MQMEILIYLFKKVIPPSFWRFYLHKSNHVHLENNKGVTDISLNKCSMWRSKSLELPVLLLLMIDRLETTDLLLEQELFHTSASCHRMPFCNFLPLAWISSPGSPGNILLFLTDSYLENFTAVQTNAEHQDLCSMVRACISLCLV